MKLTAVFMQVPEGFIGFVISEFMCSANENEKPMKMK